MLGAQGAVVGTRFCATPEALYPDWAKKQLVDGGGDETSRTQVFDMARTVYEAAAAADVGAVQHLLHGQRLLVIQGASPIAVANNDYVMRGRGRGLRAASCRGSRCARRPSRRTSS